jgi:segregation and condensation protein B
VLGRKEIPGRPLIYATTKRFLEVFGLKNLKDLPTPKEIEEFGSTLSEEMDELADEDQLEAEVSPETQLEEEDVQIEKVETETPAENPQTSMEPDEAKPD